MIIVEEIEGNTSFSSKKLIHYPVSQVLDILYNFHGHKLRVQKLNSHDDTALVHIISYVSF